MIDCRNVLSEKVYVLIEFVLQPDGKGDFPINKYGPVRVVVVDKTSEPKPVVFCEKLTTGKPRVL